MTQRHSRATAPANIADDVPADLDLLEGEWTPTNAYFPAGPKPPTASEVLLQRNYFSVTFNCKKWFSRAPGGSNRSCDNKQDI